MVQKDFLLDFDLYICERFGYRNSLHVTQTMNGFCVDVNIKPVKLYIRFWEYSNGVGGFPDWCIILVRCNFAGTCAVLQGVCATIWVQVYRD